MYILSIILKCHRITFPDECTRVRLKKLFFRFEPIQKTPFERHCEYKLYVAAATTVVSD